MSNRFKDFGSGAEISKEPLSFRIYGEDFECYPSLQGKVLLDIVANADSNDGAGMAKTISEFLEAAVKPESKNRLDDLMNDPERIVDVETLSEIMAWLVEQYSARPTQQPEL
jgi:hypothetical protein